MSFSKLLKLIQYRAHIRVQLPLHHCLGSIVQMKGRGEEESPAHQARRACNVQGTLDLLLFQHQHSADAHVGKHRELVRCGSPPENKRTFLKLGNVALSGELINTDVFPQVSISFPNFCAWKINNQADVPAASSQLTKSTPSSGMEEAEAPSSSCPRLLHKQLHSRAAAPFLSTKLNVKLVHRRWFGAW